VCFNHSPRCCLLLNYREILANSSGSELYEKFLQSLGQDIDLATHRGFNGRCAPSLLPLLLTLLRRLDSKRMSNGRIFPYFADDHVEVRTSSLTHSLTVPTPQVFFHVATRMPTASDDDQQIGKKRHIGNDYVHIVWTEDRSSPALLLICSLILTSSLGLASSREYSPLTITSDFGDVVITIRPVAPRGNETSSCGCYCVIRIYVWLPPLSLSSLSRTLR
jgi:hypothetical protein